MPACPHCINQMSVRATAIVRGKVNAPRLRKCAGGFSLIELSFTIIVIALLLGGLLVPLSTQVDQRHYARTEKQLEHIHEALIGFALANRHLPCPAVSATNGSEDRDTSTNQCTKRDGFVPWVTLGVTPADAWNAAIGVQHRQSEYLAGSSVAGRCMAGR